MSDFDTQMEEIDLTMEQAKKFISRRDTALKLTRDKLYLEVIQEGYFEDEAKRLVLLKGDPSFQTTEAQEDLDRRIFSIAYLFQYLEGIIQIGNMAERDLVEHESAKEELMDESAQE